MKLISFLILLLLMIATTVAQKAVVKPDFSGSWTLDKESSKIEDGFWNYELVITHNDPELKIIKKSLQKERIEITAMVVCYTDKRGEKNRPYSHFPNPFPVFSKFEIESETYWEGDSIVRKYERLEEVTNPAKNETLKYYIKTTEIYVLSNDQKTLTLTTDRVIKPLSDSTSSLERRVIQKFVYKKQ